jgi:outer membrane lipoprotein-sorting protein
MAMGATIFSSAVALMAVLQATPPDPMQLLKAAGDVYRSLTTYRFEIVITGGSNRQAGTMYQRYAGTRPAKFREEITLPVGGLLRVSDGVSVWAYSPGDSCYFVTKAGSPASGRPPFAPVTNEGFLESLASISDLADTATWLRTESLAIGGRSCRCDVVRVVQKKGLPAYPDAEADRQWRGEWIEGETVTYWLDRGEHIILKEEAVSARGSRMVMRYEVAVINAAIPKSQFAFSPPAGTKACRPEDVGM